MLLYLITSILLMPLVVVASPRPHGKIIYSDGHMLTEFSNLQHVPFVQFNRIDNDYALNFHVGGYHWNETQKMQLSNRPVRRMRDGKVSFVIEAVARLHRLINKEGIHRDFCRTNSSPELRHLIERCRGQISARSLTPEERSQMETFKADVEGKSLYVSYYPAESGQRRLVSKTVDAEYFDSFGIGTDLIISLDLVEDAVDAEDSVGAFIFDFEDKRFVVEGPVSESNCKNPPVTGLRAAECRGVRITDGSDDRDPTEPNQTNATEPSLED